MTYSIHHVASIAGITVRTLHHYDALGLLSPRRNASNGYREYSEDDLLTLQQIMFFRELGFPLEHIKTIVTDPDFRVDDALKQHRIVIEKKQKRINELLKTIDKTIEKIHNESAMQDEELYEGFDKEEYESWKKEAKERWGHTDAYKQSAGIYESLTKEERIRMQKEGDALMEAIVSVMDKGPHSPEAQALIQKHYDSLRFFYEPTIEIYRGLADMYIGYAGDERFRGYFEKYHADLPEFMHDAMHAFCDAQTN